MAGQTVETQDMFAERMKTTPTSSTAPQLRPWAPPSVHGTQPQGQATQLSELQAQWTHAANVDRCHHGDVSPSLPRLPLTLRHDRTIIGILATSPGSRPRVEPARPGLRSPGCPRQSRGKGGPPCCSGSVQPHVPFGSFFRAHTSPHLPPESPSVLQMTLSGQ